MDSSQKAREQLGDRLRKARKKRKLTQVKLAQLAGIHVNYYARIERGEESPSLERLRKIAGILQVSIRL